MRTFLSVLLVAGILAATAVVALVLHDGAVARVDDAERGSARRASQELEKTLAATSFRLRGVAGLFEASEQVSASEFRAFATPLFGDQHALNGVLWMPQIVDRRRRAYERANQPITEGLPNARRRAAERAVYFPVLYLETRSPVRPLGFDVASDPSRRATIRRATQLSEPRATEPVALAGTGEPGIIIYEPVFAGHAVPDTGPARERAVQGVVGGSYRLDVLLATLRESVPADTTLQVFQDDSRISGSSRIDGGEDAHVSVVGRSWTVRAVSKGSASLTVPIVVLLAGGALALLVALMLRQAFTRERYALTMVDARMTERDVAQRELEDARALAQALAAEQTALRRVATSIAAEEPLATISEQIRTELVRLFGAEDAALVHHGPGRAVSSGEPRWLSDAAERSIERCEIRIAGRPQGALALLNPASGSRARIDERLREFAELASVAIATAEARQELATRASTDGLTGLLNRRTFDERLTGEVDRAVRHGRALTLAIVDIDHFKGINDRHGHLAGDAIITDVAGQLSALARSGDAVARVGGEEFAWIMPETNLPVAFDVADRVRQAIAATDHADISDLTISVGIAELGDAIAGEELYLRADTALFQAKRSGRNRTVRHDAAQRLSTTVGER